MSLHVIEGTWEEIERHKAELMGHHLRVTITPSEPTSIKTKTPAKNRPSVQQTKKHSVRGMFAGVISTEEYFREKREDILREDRSLK